MAGRVVPNQQPPDKNNGGGKGFPGPGSAPALDRLPQALHGEFDILRLQMAPALDLGLVPLLREALKAASFLAAVRSLVNFSRINGSVGMARLVLGYAESSGHPLLGVVSLLAVHSNRIGKTDERNSGRAKIGAKRAKNNRGQAIRPGKCLQLGA
jgi:hypothetical protein